MSLKERKNSEEIKISNEKILGTFNILNPQYFSGSFEEFSAIPFENRLEKLLETLPLHVVIILCRRHPEYFIYFLRYFQHSPKAKENPKSYLPLLCEWVNKIPIQWIVMHILKIKDAHYSVLLVREVFSYQTVISPNIYEHNLELDELWEKYRELDNTTVDITREEAWNKLIEYRTSIVEINELKLTSTLSLRKYLRSDKKSLIKNMVYNIPSYSKYASFFNANISGFCQANNINIDDIIIETVVRRNWDVSQKINVLKKIKDQSKLAEALEQMTFKNDKELEEIKEFAKKLKINYTTNPTNYIQSLNALHNSNLSRSISSENLSVSASPSPNKLVRCSSLNKFDLAHSSKFTLSKVANGLPLEAQAYASKLEKYKEMEELKPIYELAKEFGVVISYDEFCKEEEKNRIFVELVTKNGHNVFEKAAEVLMLDKESVVEIVITTEEFMNDPVSIAPHLFKMLSKVNWEVIIDFLKSCYPRISLTFTCQLWIDAIKASLPFANGIKLIEIVNTVTLLKGILNLPSNEQENMFSIIKDGSFDDAKLYIKAKQFTKYFDFIVTEGTMVREDEIKKYLSSNCVEQISMAFQTISLMPPSKKSILLTSLTKELPGTNLQLLTAAFYMLKLNDMNCDNQIKILIMLFNLSIKNTDFNAVMKSPQDFVFNNVTESNIFEMIMLSTQLGLNTDNVILHLMIKKMKSTNFDDYAELISLLRREKSKEPMLAGLSSRFKDTNLMHFYEAIGENDKVRDLKVDQILISKEFSDHLSDKYKENPSLMICDFYSNIKVQEKFGMQLHKKMKKVAKYYNISITKIREHIANFWLSDTYSTGAQPTESMFIESKFEIDKRDDEVNAQRTLFVLRSWSQKNAIKWLISYIFEDKPFRAKAKAFECLFTIANEQEIAEVYTGNFNDLIEKQRAVYFCRNLEMYNYPAKESMFSTENIENTLHELSNRLDNIGVSRTVFEIMKTFSIRDEELSIRVIKSLFKYCKFFLLSNLNDFIISLDLVDNESIHDLFIRLLSYPFQEMIDKKSYLTVFKAHQISVFRVILDAFSHSPFKILQLYINDKLTPLYEIIEKSANKGWSKLSAEFGSHISDREFRKKILLILLENHHYDLAFQFCFNEDEIFTTICNNNLVDDATKLMLDDSLARFTNWLDCKENSEALNVVVSTLRLQKRTVEANRIVKRLKKANVV